MRWGRVLQNPSHPLQRPFSNPTASSDMTRLPFDEEDVWLENGLDEPVSAYEERSYD